MYTFTLENVCTPSALHAWTIDPIAIYSKEHLNVPHKSYTDMARFTVWAAIFIDTLVGTVWVVGIFVIHMVSFYGILAQLTFARVTARHLCSSIAMCAVNWRNSL